MTESTLPAPVPVVTLDTTHFWQGTTRGELILQRCDTCDAVIWYPRPICPECGGVALAEFTASGRGEIYSWTKTTKGPGDYANAGPFVLAYVQLAEGPRMMTNIVEYSDDDLVVGRSVEVIFHPTGDDSALPRVRPTQK